jgi:hypothetical protein
MAEEISDVNSKSWMGRIANCYFTVMVSDLILTYIPEQREVLNLQELNFLFLPFHTRPLFPC